VSRAVSCETPYVSTQQHGRSITVHTRKSRGNYHTHIYIVEKNNHCTFERNTGKQHAPPNNNVRHVHDYHVGCDYILFLVTISQFVRILASHIADAPLVAERVVCSCSATVLSASPNAFSQRSVVRRNGARHLEGMLFRRYDGRNAEAEDGNGYDVFRKASRCSCSTSDEHDERSLCTRVFHRKRNRNR